MSTTLKAFLVISIAISGAFGQTDAGRWQRVYTGDDATIDILTSSLTLHTGRIMSVTFRTVMSAPQTLKKQKTNIKYQSVIETIEFAPSKRQYRYSDIRWLDSAGLEVDRYEPATPTEWRSIKQGGMVDRMLEVSATSAPFGTWRVRGYRFAERGTQSPSVVSDAARLVGRAVTLTPHEARFETTPCYSPDYESKRFTSVELDQQLGIQITSIELKSDHADVIYIKCHSGSWKPPQSLLIKISEGRLLMLWQGILLELERTGTANKPVLKHSTPETASPFVFEQGAIIRGDKSKRQLSLVFTGDEFADGAATVIRTLKQHRFKASFFFTGRFYRNAAYRSAIEAIRNDGHYLGAHSNDHLLYVDWANRNQLLIHKEGFEADLNRNYEAMAEFGVSPSQARFFLPPYEWYNRTISDWTSGLGLQLVNFTPGTNSNADYTTPAMKNYIGSEAILRRIQEYEEKDPDGLNGFILLMHIGVAPERTDKFYDQLGPLIDWLKTKKYELVRIDELLQQQK